jgi:GT2 family glycosyltransferase
MTRDVGGRSIDLLANCVRSIAERTDYPHFEIVYVDNGDLRADTREALASLRGLALRAVTYTGPFNVADKMNLGARHAAGEHLLFLNDDVEVIGPGWMRAMLEYSQQPGVGAVGAKLYFPNDAVQHAGVIIPPVGSPAHVYHAFPPKRQAGIADLGVVRNYSAVTGACLMTRAEVFADLGGFDVGFPVNYNDVDYCLKVRERGLRVVFTPYAELYHFESLSRVGSADHGIRPEELARFAGRWGHVAKRDPYHDMRRTSVWLGA